MTKKHYLLVVPTSVIVALLLFAVMLSMSVVPIANAASNTIKLYTKPSTISVYSGSTASLQVRLLKSTDDWVNYVSARISYDPALVSVTGVNRSGSAFSAEGGPTVHYSNTSGTLTITGTSTDYVPTPSDSLVATVTFRAKKAGQTTIAMSSQSQAGRLVGQTNVKNYLMSTAGTRVTISAPPVVAPPSSPPVGSTVKDDTVAATDTDAAKDDTDESAASVNTEPRDAEESAAVPVEQDFDESAVYTAGQGRNWDWLYWVLGGAVFIAGFTGAVVIGRRYVAHQRVLVRKLRNRYALGGTAQYAAEYIDPERLAQRVFGNSLRTRAAKSSPSTGVVNESDSEEKLAENLQPSSDGAERAAADTRPSEAALPPKSSMHHLKVPTRSKSQRRL